MSDIAIPLSDVGKEDQTESSDVITESTQEVWWNDDNDPVNPYNWPAWKTNVNAALISLLAFVTPLASSICAPGVPQMMVEFGSSSTEDPELAAFVVSVYVLGFAFGPLLFAPMSEIYGRNMTYHICNIGFVAFVIGCALAPSLGSLITLRFLSGVFGSCPLTNSGGSIADMIPQEKRGAYMGMTSIGPLLGPIVGPVVGGALAGTKGWRWNFWLVAIIGGFITITMAIFARETYAPLILQRKANKLQKTTGNKLRSRLDDGLTATDRFKRGIIRPMKLLILTPVSTICALYMAVVYGYLYLMFTSITEVFEEVYHFSSSLVGLAFLGLGIGSMIGITITSTISDRYAKQHADIEDDTAATNTVAPEFRIRLVPVGAVLLPAGLFFYGWTTQYHVHWIVPIIAMVVVGTGNMIIFMSLVLYLVDAFPLYAASALAANTFLRSVGGALLPLAGLKLFDTLGLGWGNSLLGFITAAMIPIPFLLLRYGERLRTKFEPSDL